MPNEPEAGEPFAALLDRYRTYKDEPLEVHHVRLAEAIQGGDDPLRFVDYLRGLGRPVHRLDDLLTINDDLDEEELHAFRVQEGVAVSVASDGAWALYTA